MAFLMLIFPLKSVENAPPGTVIDVDIVHPTETDFYLLSHKGLLVRHC